jgi:hypothetical protein
LEEAKDSLYAHVLRSRHGDGSLPVEGESNSGVMQAMEDIFFEIAKSNKVEIDMTLVNAWVDSEAYKYKRVKEYPSLADFVDAYYWAQNGDDTKMTAYIEKCAEIKDKYPKA